MWGLLQSYQTWIARPAGLWLVEHVAALRDHIPIPMPEAFGAALISLLIFGIMAAFRPDLGVGLYWKPNRLQCLVIVGLISASLLYPLLNQFLGYATPVEQMGIVVWTITPVEEEILFRGLLYALALRLFHKSPDASWREILPVLLVNSIWFALWHISPQAILKYGWEMIAAQGILTFAAGLLFSVLRHWTGSIWLVIPVHAAGNFMISIM